MAPRRGLPGLLASWVIPLVGCQADGPAGGVAAGSAQNIATTDLYLDLGSLDGHATIDVEPGASGQDVRLDVSGLTLDSVWRDGVALSPQVEGGWLRVRVPAAGGPLRLEVDYRIPTSGFLEFAGWMPALGVSFIWPDHCGQLFPCDPSPADGVTFAMQVVGSDPDATLIYPVSTGTDAPSYMPGIAVGDYEKIDLGRTSAGTQIWAWALRQPGAHADAIQGTAHLTQAFDFFERTYGPYAFGPEAGSVQVDWGPGSWGGMEHHPFFHVGRFDFGNEEAQVHEAAHGWFGDAVRLACWEDFVLSEGTVTYMTARALQQVGGPDVWPYYVDDFLVPICTGRSVNTIALREGCGTLDFEQDSLWSLATYMKGACFYGDVAEVLGADTLDAAISDYYRSHRNQAGRMQDMIATLKDRADDNQAAAIDRLVEEWLLTLACPADYARRCRAHPQP